MSKRSLIVVIVISEFLERYLQAQCTSYSRALRRIKLVLQRVVCGKLRGRP